MMQNSLAVVLGAYMIFSLIVIWAGYRHLIRKFNRIMEQVNDAVQSLIDNTPYLPFEQNQDDLLGKFQTQLLKLYRILNSYEERERLLRNSLEENISNVAHQINTPVTNVRLYSGFLLQENLSKEERSRFAGLLVRQAEKLEWLGESFGKAARLESGLIVLHPHRQEVLPALLEAIDQVSLRAEERGNDIVLKGKQNLTAVFDRKWTTEVFFNLLDNAVKYSDRGTGITVEILDCGMYVRVNVKDRGIQILEEDYSKIFRRFYRCGNVEKQEGVGLGLYLARLIVEEQGGYLKVFCTHEAETGFAVFLYRENSLEERNQPSDFMEKSFGI